MSELKVIQTLPGFSKDAVKEAKHLFTVNRTNGLIISSLYSENEWTLDNQYQHVILNFAFDKEAYDKFYASELRVSYAEMIDYMKTFIMFHFPDYIFTSMQSIVNTLKHILTTPPDNIEKDTDHRLVYWYQPITEFFSLMPKETDIQNQLLDSFEALEDSSYESVSSSPRKLACFESYFKFNDCICDFWKEETSKELKLFYFPIVLWWFFTAVIPSRPKEFVLMPRNCLTRQDDQWFITVRKTRIKGAHKIKTHRIDDDYVETTFGITEELAKMIQWYIDETKTLPVSEYNTLFRTDFHYWKWYGTVPYTSRCLTYTNLHTILRYFYQEIVCERYDYTIIYDTTKEASDLKENEIQFINLGDSRHISMINIVLEGTPLTVTMTLAGHSSISTSANYFANATRYLECRAKHMYQKSKSKTAVSIMTKAPISTKSYTPISGNGNRCYSPLMANGDYSDCLKVAGKNGEIGKCTDCSFFRTRNTSFNEDKATYEAKIKKNVDTLVNLVTLAKTTDPSQDFKTAQLRLMSSMQEYQAYLISKCQEDEKDGKEKDYS